MHRGDFKKITAKSKIGGNVGGNVAAQNDIDQKIIGLIRNNDKMTIQAIADNLDI